jgi:hypothetical protein
MRFLVLLLSLLALGACTSAEPPELARPTAPVASPAAEPAMPTDLTCRGDRTMTRFRYLGVNRFTAMLEGMAEHGRPWVDRDRQRIWFLRPDGTAHTVATWDVTKAAGHRRTWYLNGYEQCWDRAKWRDVAAPSTDVELVVGHCWVEPVEVDGRTWDLIREDQFGWGGEQPKGIVTQDRLSTNGTQTMAGQLISAGDVAVYVDQSGVRLTLVPEGDPWVIRRGGCD